MEQYSTEEMNFCGNVKRLREHLQLSKDDMAKLCGVNALGIRGIEHGCLSSYLVLKISAGIYTNLHIPPSAMISEDVLRYRGE